MSFISISVKEAVNKINANYNGWFLPAVQRPYVWGSRYESEKYICKLFDSILNGYPIGTLIVWRTEMEVPYREFMDDFHDGKTAVLVEKSLWSRVDKWLVYDGQQRLQTLYSCLKYTLNNRVLAYDLLYESDGSDEEYGFKFIDKNTDAYGHIKLPELFSKTKNEKVSYRKKIQAGLEMSEEQEIVFESRFDKLWSVFVEGASSIAYFPMDKDWSEDKVNDVFQRLNTGGVPLSGADLLFSKIKEENPYFEENLVEISKWISEVTNGYYFSSNEILQLINLIVKGTTRIDASKIKASEIEEFNRVGSNIGEPLKDFFKGFFSDAFNINNSAIISKKLAVLPLIVYSYKSYQKGNYYHKLSAENIKRMKKYFILSQLNDWNTQGIVEGGTREIGNDDFPLDKFMEVAIKKNRVLELKIETLESNVWFTLKISLPHRLYIKQETTTGRYRPELDHIFPMRLAGRPEEYDVDVIWNLQPVTGKTNLLKSNMHPKKFFSDYDTKMHISEYDFIPKDMTSELWDNHKKFIEFRKKQMINFLENKYDLEIK